MKCPIHKTVMERTKTRYGYRYDCMEQECTMMCWGGETSTPADQETRDARIKAHALFDALDMSKGQRYRWMQTAMDLPPDLAHIGMFSADQCAALIEKIKQAERERDEG